MAMLSRSKSSCLMPLAIVLVMANITQAQEDRTATADAQKNKETEERQELEKKTLGLLNDVASAAWSLKLPENRTYIISNTADLLWTVDEKRARSSSWRSSGSGNSETNIRGATCRVARNLSSAS